METKYFIKRTTAPSTDNKFYLKAGKGGYNRAMEINSTTHSCLPNCCGEVHGRWLESQEQTDYNKYDRLCTGDAHSYWGYVYDDYERGQTPRLGAIICWSKDGGAGHVAFVEEVYDNGDILSSNSGYNGSRFYTKKLTKASNYNFGSKYHFQGFIYPPVNFTDDIVVKPVERDTTKDQLKVVTTSLRVRKEPSTDSAILGFVQTNGIYNYYDVKDNQGYKWYKIEDEQWIANNGEWLEIYPKEEDEKVIEELKKELAEEQAKNKVLEEKNETLSTLNQALQEENNKLVDDLDKFRNVYTCEETGTYKFRIKLYKDESLYIK